jgi:GNAT superfamily N-acetyltransferase
MRFRVTTAEDVNEVAGLVVRADATVAAWTPGFGLPEGHADRELEIWQTDIAGDNFWSEVALADGAIVGVVAGEPSDGHIVALFVEPTLHGRGIGAELLERGEARLRDAGRDQATVNVLAGSPAIRFYERNGYAPNGRSGRFEPFDMATIGYSKSLKP